MPGDVDGQAGGVLVVLYVAVMRSCLFGCSCHCGSRSWCRGRCRRRRWPCAGWPAPVERSSVVGAAEHCAQPVTGREGQEPALCVGDVHAADGGQAFGDVRVVYEAEVALRGRRDVAVGPHGGPEAVPVGSVGLLELRNGVDDALPIFGSLCGCEECVPCGGVVLTAPFHAGVDSDRVRHVGVAQAHVDQGHEKSAGTSSPRAVGARLAVFINVSFAIAVQDGVVVVHVGVGIA